jgi:hypothetical protein
MVCSATVPCRGTQDGYEAGILNCQRGNTMRYLANSMEVKIRKVADRKWKVAGHSPQDKKGRHFGIGTLELVPYDSGEPDKDLFLIFKPGIGQAESADGTETWLEARSFTAKELRKFADLMDSVNGFEEPSKPKAKVKGARRGMRRR